MLSLFTSKEDVGIGEPYSLRQLSTIPADLSYQLLIACHPFGGGLFFATLLYILAELWYNIYHSNEVASTNFDVHYRY